MSDDCYVAICKPLHYVTVMSSRVFQILNIGSWMAALCMMIPPLSLGLLVTLKFCDSNMIDHFPFDAVPLVEISCSETDSDNLCCTDPYDVKGKGLFSHIIVVSITYGTCMLIYMNPATKEQVTINKIVSLLIFSISPLLNPFIYTLRNKKEAGGGTPGGISAFEKIKMAVPSGRSRGCLG
ncbi:hypothetical protein QTO34_017465 [Cnephaeus nilssonii]|uniref:G-protein coupled receptors family 1 profile domain-containing protein n=1 Tax=Cnephaeus nilssonii TaxID=3371016 RepID=A0AA40I120_CNENI|nr:hypothetical protein QTO34_017465 [Eptesicus nilssonii]